MGAKCLQSEIYTLEVIGLAIQILGVMDLKEREIHLSLWVEIRRDSRLGV